MGEAAKKKQPKLAVPSVLVADNDPRACNQVDILLSSHGFDVVTVGTAHDAVDALKQKRYDIMLLGLTGNTRSGWELLKKIKGHKILRTLPVVMMADLSEEDVEKLCEEGDADDFLVKPFQEDDLYNKVVSAIRANSSKGKIVEGQNNGRRTLLQILAIKLQKEEISLPSAPKLLHKIINMLNDENVSMSEIASVIEKEPSISSRIIKAANSSEFAGSKPARNAQEAVMRLGLKRMLNYVIVVNNAQMFTVDNPLIEGVRQEIWRHSLITGICARYIGVQSGYSQPDNLFAYGLLHDLGKLSLLRVLQELPEDTPMDTESIYQTVNRFHTHFGGTLLDRWVFPREFVDIAARHHDAPIRGVHGKYLIITAFANKIAHAFDEGEMDETTMGQLMRLPHAGLLKIQQTSMTGLEEAVNREMEAMKDLF